MSANNDVNFYLVMREKYKKESLIEIDDLWVKASAKLGTRLTVYMDEGQELIEAVYRDHFKY